MPPYALEKWEVRESAYTGMLW